MSKPTHLENPKLDMDGNPIGNDSPIPGVLWDKQTGLVARYDEAALFENDDAAAIALAAHLYTEHVASGWRQHDRIVMFYAEDFCNGNMWPHVMIEEG